MAFDKGGIGIFTQQIILVGGVIGVTVIIQENLNGCISLGNNDAVLLEKNLRAKLAQKLHGIIRAFGHAGCGEHTMSAVEQTAFGGGLLHQIGELERRHHGKRGIVVEYIADEEGCLVRGVIARVALPLGKAPVL